MWPVLTIGSRGADVGNWQRFLRAHDISGDGANPIAVDEAFGPITSNATRIWQAREGLALTGIVGRQDRVIASTTLEAQGPPYIPFLQAKHFTPVYPKARTIDLIVIHSMEVKEKPDAAENVALWFAGLSSYAPPKASCHYAIDTDNAVQCVRDQDVAWHAPGANHNGIGFEHAGFARQTHAEWNDVASTLILDRSARIAAQLATRYNIPLVKLAPDELKAGLRGFVGHHDCTIAFPGPRRNHWDPGGGFPWNTYLENVRRYT